MGEGQLRLWTRAGIGSGASTTPPPNGRGRGGGSTDILYAMGRTLQLHKYPHGSSGKGVEDRVAASL